MDLPGELVELLRRPSIGFLTTLMPDGSPQITEVWVDTDGKHVLVNTVAGHQKVRNVARDPRVALAVADAGQPSRYIQVRGRVLDVTEHGAVEHIDALSQRYLGRPYPWFGDRTQPRLLMQIEAERVTIPRG